MGAELFFKPADVLQASLSPNGQRLAITTAIGGERVGIFVFDLATLVDGQPAKITRAARFRDIDVRNVQWVDDERLLFSLIDLTLGGAQQEAPGLYLVRYDGEDLKELISPRFAIITSPNSSFKRYALHPNHRLLQVPRRDAHGEVVVGELLGVGRELRSVRPLWLGLSSGRTRDASARGPADALEWLFDGAGEARVAITHDKGRRQVHWRAPGQDDWRVIDDSEDLRTTFSPAFVGDDGTLYVTRREAPQGMNVLTRFDFASGRPQRDPMVRVQGFDYAGAPVFDRGRAGLLGMRVESDAQTTVWFDERMKRLQQEADEHFRGHVVDLRCARCGADDMVALAWAYSDREPGLLWLYRASPPPRADGTPGLAWRPLGRARNGVDAQRMGTVSLQRIAARDGRELPVWVTLPAGYKPGAPGSAIVLVHGGPWVRGGHWRWSAMEQFLASRGHVVISPDFRGSTGYGRAHFEAGFRQWGQSMQDDVADATRWAAAQGLANRFCIAGASYGGYSTLMGLIRDSELYRCGVAWVAPTDPFLLLQGSWWIDDDTTNYSRRYTLPQLIGDAERDATMLEAASPLKQAARIKRPLLLAYGESDVRVPLAHGERLRAALRSNGNEPLWVSYGGEGHGWLRMDTKLDFARRVEAFLDEQLKP